MIFQLFDSLDEFLMAHLSHLGFSLDLVKLVIYFFTNVGCGLFLRLFVNSYVRTMLSLLFSLFYLLFMGKEWFVFVMASTMLVYFCVIAFKQKCFWPVFFISFSFLSYVHYYRLVYDYLSWKMGFDTIQMMATVRYLYFANDVCKNQYKQANFFEYLAYVFMFSNLLIGPIPCRSFIEFLRLDGDYKNIKYLHRPWLITISKAIAFMVGEVLIRPKLDDKMFQSDFWRNGGQLERNALLFIIGIALRFKYFTAFKFTQAGLDGLAITYQEKDGKVDYERFSVADYRYELEESPINKTNQWNSLVQLWCKTCLFERFAADLGDGMAFYVTFLVSAYWHGFYLTYYYMFIFWALLNHVAKFVYKARAKFSLYVLAYLLSSHAVNQIAIPVFILDWDRAMQLGKDLYFNGHISIIILFILFTITGFGQQSSKKEKKKL